MIEVNVPKFSWRRLYELVLYLTRLKLRKEITSKYQNTVITTTTIGLTEKIISPLKTKPLVLIL
jgi:hypothetical protein